MHTTAHTVIVEGLLLFWNFRSVAKTTGANLLQKWGVKCQLLNVCDCEYTRMVSKESPYEYGVPYWYSDARSCMVILRVWVLIYIYTLWRGPVSNQVCYTLAPLRYLILPQPNDLFVILKFRNLSRLIQPL